MSTQQLKHAYDIGLHAHIIPFPQPLTDRNVMGASCLGCVPAPPVYLVDNPIVPVRGHFKEGMHIDMERTPHTA